MGRAMVVSWFDTLIPLEISPQNIVLATPNRFVQQHLVIHFLEKIRNIGRAQGWGSKEVKIILKKPLTGSSDST